MQNVENQIALTNASIQALTKQRQLDEQTFNYQNLQAEIDKLKKKRIDWIPVLETISSKLPSTGRILSAEMANEEKKEDNNGANPAVPQTEPVIVNLKLEFGALTSVADYILLLQSSSLFDSVSIMSAIKTEKTFSTPIASLPGSNGTNTQSTTVNTEDNINKIFEDTLTDSKNEGDNLLNELKWTINQQIAKQEFGLKLPDKNFGTKLQDDQYDQDETSALTDADYEDARKTLEDMKKKSATSSETGANSPSVENSNPAAASVQKFNVYEVVIEIALKNSVDSN